MAPSCSQATPTASAVAMAVWNHGRSDGQHGAPWEPKSVFSWLFLLLNHHRHTGSLSWARGHTSSRNRFHFQALWAVTSARFWNCHDHGICRYCAAWEPKSVFSWLFLLLSRHRHTGSLSWARGHTSSRNRFHFQALWAVTSARFWNCHDHGICRYCAPWEPKSVFSWLFLLLSRHRHTGSLSWARGHTSSRNRFHFQALWAVTSARFWNCHDHGICRYCAAWEPKSVFSWLFLLLSRHRHTGSLSWARGHTSSRNRFHFQALWAVTSARFWNCHDHGICRYCAAWEPKNVFSWLFLLLSRHRHTGSLSWARGHMLTWIRAVRGTESQLTPPLKK